MNEKRGTRKTVAFGDLVVEAFDRAALDSTDALEISRQARETLGHVLERSRGKTPVGSGVLVGLSNY